MTVSLVFLLIAGIILLGFAGNWIFRLTRIPEVMLLIAAGYGLQHVLGVEAELVRTVAPYFGAFALVVILFDGGLHLGIEQILKNWKHAFKLLSIVFLLSFAAIASLAHWAFEYSTLNSMLLASALACTSAAIVVPLIRQVRVPRDIQAILELESSLSDAFAVLFTVTALNIATMENADGARIGLLILSSLTGSVIIGTIAGFLWVPVMKKMAGQPLSYLVTFAVMMLVYAASEFVHSSGIFGVFIFGMAYANGPDVYERLFRIKSFEILEREDHGLAIKGFHAELTFLVRTFFFVFLGLLFDFKSVTGKIFLQSVAIYAVIVLARWAAVQWIKLDGDPTENRRASRVFFLFMPRGLASAVLVTLPLNYGISGTQDFITIAVLIVLFTNLAITFGVRWVERTPDAAPSQP